MQTIISWNVASVRARLGLLLTFLAQEQPDVMMLQEVKATDDTFPFFELAGSGYKTVLSGQKGFNGVALLIRQDLTAQNILTSLPGVENEVPQARFCQAEIKGITYISVYVPNGNPPEKDPFNPERLHYKLRWMTALTNHVRGLIQAGKEVILGGDFNVIEHDTDVYNPEAFRETALMLPAVREAFATLQATGLENMVRRFNPKPHTYSFWDFQGGAWARNNGILLDAIFVTKALAKNITGASIYRNLRGAEKPSDHVPVGCVLND